MTTPAALYNLYNIGLPAWAFPGWNGQYFNSSPSTLASYSQVFNAVEGNTTFYHVPDAASVANWCESLQSTELKISFKLPRAVTHERSPDLQQLRNFLARIEPLGKHIGPLLLQFPATLGPSDSARLEQLCAQLPASYRYVIEVRHPDFFIQPNRLTPLLEKFRLGRVMMDTRPIFRGNRRHPEVLTALHEKPDVPVLSQVYNGLVFVRLLLHPDLTSNDLYIEQWTIRIAQALAAGCQCYMMIHCPNNLHCPPLARTFHERLVARMPDSQLPPLPPWPVPQQHSLI